jgi:hypothetical protein
MSVNSPAGSCAKALGLRGPSTTISIGEGSGLLAIVLAAEWLALRADADFLVAGAVDELNPHGADTEASVCVLLGGDRNDERPAAGMETNEAIVVAGWGLAGAGEIRSAAEQALHRLGPPDAVFSDGPAARACLAPVVADAALLPGGFVDVSEHCGRAEATRSAIAFVEAVKHLRAGFSRSALVTTARSGSASCAVLLLR